jgi:hypothetical protein
VRTAPSLFLQLGCQPSPPGSLPSPLQLALLASLALLAGAQAVAACAAESECVATNCGEAYGGPATDFPFTVDYTTTGDQATTTFRFKARAPAAFTNLRGRASAACLPVVLVRAGKRVHSRWRAPGPLTAGQTAGPPLLVHPSHRSLNPAALPPLPPPPFPDCRSVPRCVMHLTRCASRSRRCGCA